MLFWGSATIAYMYSFILCGTIREATTLFAMKYFIKPNPISNDTLGIKIIALVTMADTMMLSLVSLKLSSL